MSDWNHERVFLALLKREKDWGLRRSNIYAHLYPQKQNCAILYSPKASKAFRENPLHLKEPAHLREAAKNDWDDRLFEQIQPFIKVKPDHPDKNNFDWHRVNSWNGFATALKLELS